MNLNNKFGVWVIFILAVLLLVSGCAKKAPPTLQNESGVNGSGMNLSPNITHITQTITQTGFIKIKSINFVDDTQILPCHYLDKLTAESPILINDSKIVIKLELINLSNDSVKVKINEDKEVMISLNKFSEIKFDNDAIILFTISVMRDDYALICTNINEKYDIAFCETKSGSNRFMCFNNLGHLNGFTYCDTIQTDSDQAACKGGASGSNG